MILAPGSTIGMLGGGQLGRMAALAARPLGYRVLVFDPAPECPAGQVADGQIVAPFEDQAALARFAAQIDVATLEFENLPLTAVETLAERVPVRPSPSVLRICQDRLAERAFLKGIGVPTARSMPLRRLADAMAFPRGAYPALLKTARLGYDGKGQRAVAGPDDLSAAHAALGGVPCLLEERVALERELSVIVARDVQGQAITYPPAENAHVAGILDTSMVPAPIAPDLAAAAREIALDIAAALDLVGVLAAELFVTAAGRLLVNELAPRPHNTGHWSIEACRTSQFTQQIRLAIGAPPGAPDLLRPAACANLLGDLWYAGPPRWERLLAFPDVSPHLYGKGEARPGRKMGHLTALAETAEAARARVLEARSLLARDAR